MHVSIFLQYKCSVFFKQDKMHTWEPFLTPLQTSMELVNKGDAYQKGGPPGSYSSFIVSACTLCPFHAFSTLHALEMPKRAVEKITAVRNFSQTVEIELRTLQKKRSRVLNAAGRTNGKRKGCKAIWLGRRQRNSTQRSKRAKLNYTTFKSWHM